MGKKFKKTLGSISFTARRWSSIAALTLIGVVVCKILDLALTSSSRWLTAFFRSQSLSVGFFEITLLVSIAANPLRKLGGLHPTSIRYFLHYPPCWTASIAAFAIYCTENAEWKGFSYKEWVSALGPLASGILIDYVYASVHRPQPLSRKHSIAVTHLSTNNKESDERASTPSTSFDLLQWVNFEQPIGDDDQDLLGATAIADRIVLAIGDSKQIAIQGGFGSGKSSIRTLIDKRLKANKVTWTVTVDGWDISDKDIANVVLTRVVHELGRHLDVFAIAGLPGRYRSAVTGSKSATASVFMELASLVPTESVRALDDILSTVDRRLVIYLEDLDRAAGPAILPSIAGLLD